MNQQMTQFMQMQMQFMQMMAVGGQQGGAMGARPMSYMPPQSVADMSSRQSFVGDTMFAMNSMMDPGPRPGMAPSMRSAARAGFVTLMIGLATGAAMIARGVVQVDAGHQQEAYDEVGFLKPVHAISLHGILVLQAVAWLLSLTPADEARRTRIVAIAIAGYGLAIAAALAYSLWLSP
jgi:hypothetical protein